MIFNWKHLSVAQCNNAFIFPGLGLGIISSQAKKVTSRMMDAATIELANSVNTPDNSNVRLLPEVSMLREVSKKIGIAVARQAISEGVASTPENEDIEKLVDSNIWEPVYMPYKPLNNV